jgi:hypothetical protein
MFAILAAICYGVAFILHWGGGGKSPFDVLGLVILGSVLVAIHLATGIGWPWRHT